MEIYNTKVIKVIFEKRVLMQIILQSILHNILCTMYDVVCVIYYQYLSFSNLSFSILSQKKNQKKKTKKKQPRKLGIRFALQW